MEGQLQWRFDRHSELRFMYHVSDSTLALEAQDWPQRAHERSDYTTCVAIVNIWYISLEISKAIFHSIEHALWSRIICDLVELWCQLDAFDCPNPPDLLIIFEFDRSPARIVRLLCSTAEIPFDAQLYCYHVDLRIFWLVVFPQLLLTLMVQSQ